MSDTNHRKVRLTNSKDIHKLQSSAGYMDWIKNQKTHTLKTNQNLHSYITDKKKNVWKQKNMHIHKTN